MKKQPANPSEPASNQPRQTTILLHKEDDAAIDRGVRLGRHFGVRLSDSAVMRLLIRNADLKTLTKKDFEKAAAQDGRLKKKV